MYLGQLAKLREVFASSRVTVALDSRDQEALMDKEGDRDAINACNSVVVQDVQLHQQVRYFSDFLQQPTHQVFRYFCGQ